tara:strand:- start:2918 stop:3361 length:444 start_codon:yes stop_codon:yes gene_type:complete
MPFALANFSYGFTQGRLEIGKTFLSGNFIFSTSTKNDVYDGRAIANNLIYKRGLGDREQIVIAHETIHVFQYEGYFWFNNFFQNSPLFESRTFYIDYNYILLRALHDSQKLFGVPYSDRFYEKEAFYFQKTPLKITRSKILFNVKKQ